MKGVKKVFKVDQLKKLNVPSMKDTEVKVVYPILIDRFPDIREYLPDYPPKTFPERDYLWTVFSTHKPSEAKSYVDVAIKKQVESTKKEKKDAIEILPSIL